MAFITRVQLLTFFIFCNFWQDAVNLIQTRLLQDSHRQCRSPTIVDFVIMIRTLAVQVDHEMRRMGHAMLSRLFQGDLFISILEILYVVTCQIRAVAVGVTLGRHS